MKRKCKIEGCDRGVVDGLPWCLEHLNGMGQIMGKYPPVSSLFEKM
jgi:hypothetical protein